MIHLLWGLLNLFLLVVFFKTLYQSAFILSKELSRFSLLVLVLGVLSHACRPGKEVTEEKNQVWENERVAEMESPTLRQPEIMVEDQLLFDRKISYFYGKDSLGNRVIAKAFWSQSGLQAFTQSHLESFTIHNGTYSDMEHPENSLNGTYYVAHVREDWYLLGFKAFTQSRQFRGTIL